MALDDWRIARNTIVNVKGRNGGGRAGIFIWVGSRNVIVERNLILGCDRGIAFGNPSPSTNGADLHVSNSICRNNFIVGGLDAGIELAWVEGVRILHNSIWRSDPGARGIRSIEKVGGTVIANNLVRGRVLLSGPETSRGNVAEALDGYFRDPAAGDLHLTAQALQALDKAGTEADVPADFDGDPRPHGAKVDLGADEFGTPTSASRGPMLQRQPAGNRRARSPVSRWPLWLGGPATGWKSGARVDVWVDGMGRATSAPGG